MNAKSILLVFGIVLSIAMITGCAMHIKSDYVLKTEEQLVEQLKSEYPDCFVPCGEPIAVQDASKLIGEWEQMKVNFVQIDASAYEGLDKNWIHFTYQFFADGTLNRIDKNHLGTSEVRHGIWSYENGLLQFHYLKDNVFQRESTPYKIIWHKNSIIELQISDFDMLKRNIKVEQPSTTYHSQHYKYDTNHCLIAKYDFTSNGVRVKNISVVTPVILKRIGKVVKPSDVGMQNLITNNTRSQSIVRMLKKIYKMLF